jgi:hypothetical protein
MATAPTWRLQRGSKAVWDNSANQGAGRSSLRISEDRQGAGISTTIASEQFSRYTFISFTLDETAEARSA